MADTCHARRKNQIARTEFRYIAFFYAFLPDPDLAGWAHRAPAEAGGLFILQRSKKYFFLPALSEEKSPGETAGAFKICRSKGAIGLLRE